MSFNLILRMLIDAPRYDYDKDKETKTIDLTKEDAWADFLKETEKQNQQ